MRLILALLGLPAIACAFSVSWWTAGIRQHERVDILPHGWQNRGKADEAVPITLRAYLKYPNQEYIQLAEDVSDPSSPLFGQHLGADELTLALPDTTSAAKQVLAWLNQNDIQDCSYSRDWIDFSTSVSQANKLLHTTFFSYQYLEEDPVLRVPNYALPHGVAKDIDFIYPTVHFFSPNQRKVPALSKRQHVPTGPANCSNSVCPPQLKKQYNISYRPIDNKSGSKLGIAGFLDTFPNITDVKSFLTQYGIDKKAAFPAYNTVSINKGRITAPPADRSDLTVEPELDLDYSIAFTGPLPIVFYSTGGRATQLSQPGSKPHTPSNNEPYLEFMQYTLAQPSPPQVISISYSDDEQSVPEAYARRVCSLFAQAAARGISIIGSSGDGGASGTGGDTTCKGPDGKHRFIPTFPSSCPWITSVGATAAFGGAASFSSGGLSNYFARPTWQDKHVANYIQELNGKHKSFYNASGRGIPDVSLLGDDYLTLTAGFPGVHDGTSASAPVFAAMIALVNDVRLRNKKQVLGFLNPLLYAAKAQSVFRDVNDDSESIGCADGNFFESGWEALKGWDAATGLGEPDFEKLRAMLA